MICSGLRQGVATRSLRPIRVEISPGDLLDKLTILKIKSTRIFDEAKLRNVRAELTELSAACEESVPATLELAELVDQLESVNATLWRIEDDIRRCEREQDFGPTFVELARSVYRERCGTSRPRCTSCSTRRREYRRSTRGGRDPQRLAALPPEERQRWEAFWTDVRAELAKATGKPRGIRL